MRFRDAIILSTLIAGLWTAGNAWATGNVLLPSSDNGNGGGSLPNLGLTPAEPPPELPPLPKETKPAEAAPPQKIALPPEAAPQPESPTVNPLPSQLPEVPSYPSQPQIQQPRPLPYSLHASLVETGLWNANDIATVSDQLGIPKAHVVDQCKFGFNGMLITDRGANPVESNVATSTDIAYEGSVTNAMFGLYAACASAPKPATYSYIQKIGNRFAISIGSAFCVPTTPFAGTLRHVVIQHASDGNDTCSYR